MHTRDEIIKEHQNTLRTLADDIDRIDVLMGLGYSESELEEASSVTDYLEGWRAHLEENAKVVLRELTRLNP